MTSFMTSFKFEVEFESKALVAVFRQGECSITVFYYSVIFTTGKPPSATGPTPSGGVGVITSTIVLVLVLFRTFLKLLTDFSSFAIFAESGP
jgi:hypothetical protein